MRHRIIALLTIAATVLLLLSCSQKVELEALILTGQNNHNWKGSTPVLKSILEKTGIFHVLISTSPEKGEDMSGFVVDFSPYDVVVLDYNGDEWPDETKNNFVEYVKNGGAVVVYHAADNAFPDWPEFNEIIGLGGWGNRDENSGPYVYIESGEVVRDNSEGRGGSHGSQHEFVVEAYQAEHPILKGLPQKWLHTQDELYSELRGPAKNLEVLAFSHADKKYGGTGRNEPVLMTVTYGEGRIFHTVLGHAGGGPFHQAMECAGFITTFQRGAEWAATGKVSQKVPVAFPNEEESLRWEFLEDITSDITPVIDRMREYEIGNSNECFTILQKLMRENIGNAEKMDEYHEIVLGLLQSEKTTDACKKELCKEFSWMANESYVETYKKLKENPKLADEAQYALDRLNR